MAAEDIIPADEDIIASELFIILSSSSIIESSSRIMAALLDDMTSFSDGIWSDEAGAQPAMSKPKTPAATKGPMVLRFFAVRTSDMKKWEKKQKLLSAAPIVDRADEE